MPDVPSSTIEADIARLETSIRQLKVQYDMFFAGSLPRQPFELRAQIERMIKRYANASIRKYQHRFHFNTLVARYNALSELWGKSMRTLEEGDRPVPAVAERVDRRERTLAACRLAEADAENRHLQKLHSKFVQARKRGGDSLDIPYAAFVKKIAAQTRQLQEKSGCRTVELRVVVRDRKVQLKAKPAR